ncbi:MAG: ribosomal protein S18-alanine N-acetyltransferase [Lachnospiraceae bacterium]|nr:ribosomal protein S18-alanine N-acetyltransferase [Lachnospiraceae bacterium]
MIIYEHMKISDCAKAAELESVIFGRDAWTKEDFEESLCCDYAVYVVARDMEKDALIACAGIRNMCGDGDITNVLVDKTYREHGIAEHLLKYLIREGTAIGVRNFTLEVRKSNTPAIHLYEKLGFVSEGIRPGFYDNPKEDAIIFWMRKPETA